ncbi:hypothetical protein LO763_14055 [Glycomyces sp. A-F 0318]|uniref:hypothetical protein n=1 Tax=Glycomyces amatae TaxID=2881355 RepID=UPI001E364E6E|nr:hypothetical protein [Glycomyces amatae]MCD0444741.1 hypothetical protein [Glycomyces amatae]
MSRAPRRGYGTKFDGPVRFYPLVLGGATVGYLCAAADEARPAAGTILILSALDMPARIDLAVLWERRLADAATAGLRPLEALEQWRGAPEDSVGGAIPPGAQLRDAASAAVLVEWANPGEVPPSDLAGPVPQPPPGRNDWRLSHPEIEARERCKSYPRETPEQVRYLPVRMDHDLIGYVWASVTDDAAGFMQNQRSGKTNWAEVWWLEEFVKLHGAGLSPLEALRARSGAPQHPTGGRIDPMDWERTANDLNYLFRLAQKGRLPPWRY